MPREITEKYPQFKDYNYSIEACLAFKYNFNLPICPVDPRDQIDGFCDGAKDSQGREILKINPILCKPECHQRIFTITTA